VAAWMLRRNDMSMYSAGSYRVSTMSASFFEAVWRWRRTQLPDSTRAATKAASDAVAPRTLVTEEPCALRFYWR
jgi:hypothetical protein